MPSIIIWLNRDNGESPERTTYEGQWKCIDA